MVSFGRNYIIKIGLIGLSCNQCHDERVGSNLRAEKVSQGQINGFPSYLLKWSKVVLFIKEFNFVMSKLSFTFCYKFR